MFLDQLPASLEPTQVLIAFGMTLGLLFGLLAARSGFCLRRALVGPRSERCAAGAVWLAALAAAILSTQLATLLGWLDLSGHRFLNKEVAWPAVILGGTLFGIGMVLCRGCISRLVILSVSGNLRAPLALMVIALFAQMSLSGVLAPVRSAITAFRFELDEASLFGATPITIAILCGLLFAILGTMAWRGKARLSDVLSGLIIGLLVTTAWLGTSSWFSDPFDPVSPESLSYTQPLAQTLFHALAATAITPNFGVSLIWGTLLGSLLWHLFSGSMRWQGFESRTHAARMLGGAALMGFGGVLAGGCTIGAGLGGTSTLSLAAFGALSSIVCSAVLFNALLQRDEQKRSRRRAESRPEMISKPELGIVRMQ